MIQCLRVLEWQLQGVLGGVCVGCVCVHELLAGLLFGAEAKPWHWVKK